MKLSDTGIASGCWWNTEHIRWVSEKQAKEVLPRYKKQGYDAEINMEPVYKDNGMLTFVGRIKMVHKEKRNNGNLLLDYMAGGFLEELQIIWDKMPGATEVQK